MPTAGQQDSVAGWVVVGLASIFVALLLLLATLRGDSPAGGPRIPVVPVRLDEPAGTWVGELADPTTEQGGP